MRTPPCAQSDGDDCCNYKCNGDIVAHDNTLPLLFLVLLLHGYCYTCAPSSSSCYYIVVTTWNVVMAKPHTKKWKKIQPQTTKVVVFATGVMIMLMCTTMPSPSSSCYYCYVVIVTFMRHVVAIASVIAMLLRTTLPCPSSCYCCYAIVATRNVMMA